MGLSHGPSLPFSKRILVAAPATEGDRLTLCGSTRLAPPAAGEIRKNACSRTIPHVGEDLSEYGTAVASARWRTASARPSPIVAGVGVDRALNGIYNCHA